MKILLLGSGGREHALAWKISQSKYCETLYIAPGNAGTAMCGTNVSILETDIVAVKNFIIKNEIDLLVIGPEQPLVDGITDILKQCEETKNIIIIGPTKKGAQLEGSKDFAKQFMEKYHIPTAKYASFDKNHYNEAEMFLQTMQPPFVLKADGLAAGKGVIISSDVQEAKKELKHMLLEDKFGKAGQKVVIEQFLNGIELSVFVLTDGDSYCILPSAKDYKRIGEGDTGLNTGGMGSISPVPFADNIFMQKVEQKIIKPTIEGLKNEKIDYCGFIFFGLMNVAGEPYVIEYNVRLGDPETESVLPRLKNDLVELFIQAGKKQLCHSKILIDNQTVATIILVSGGYPEHYEKNKLISGTENVTDSQIFYAGTQKDENGNLITYGGRVLAVTSFGQDIIEALSKSKTNAQKIHFDKMYFRQDIGKDLCK